MTEFDTFLREINSVERLKALQNIEHSRSVLNFLDPDASFKFQFLIPLNAISKNSLLIPLATAFGALLANRSKNAATDLTKLLSVSLPSDWQPYAVYALILQLAESNIANDAPFLTLARDRLIRTPIVTADGAREVLADLLTLLADFYELV